MAPVRMAGTGFWAAVHKVKVDREPSSPCRSVTRSVVHPGIRYGSRVRAEKSHGFFQFHLTREQWKL